MALGHKPSSVPGRLPGAGKDGIFKASRFVLLPPVVISRLNPQHTSTLIGVPMLELLNLFSNALVLPSCLLMSKGSFSVTFVNCWWGSQLFGCWEQVVSSELSANF